VDIDGFALAWAVRPRAPPRRGETPPGGRFIKFWHLARLSEDAVDVSSSGIVLIAAGIFIIALEIVHPGIFLLIPGTIVLVAGILYTFVPDFLFGTIFGPLIVALAAIVATIATLPYYQRLGKGHRPLVTTPDSLTGEIGVVVVPVVPDSMKGKVRVRSEIWSARADIAIPEGARVRVRGGQGVSVWVEPFDQSRPVPASVVSEPSS
jgi:inner membrane protein